MIRLTIKASKKPIYIAPELITAICGNREGGAEVYSGHDMSLVAESPEEVARKALEYRLALEDYKHDDSAPAANKKLFELAGLEG